jgi:hypothetical protein
MSEEQIMHGQHENEEVEFEREDLSASGVFAFLLGLALAGILIYFILNGMYRYLDAYQKRNQPAQNPLAAQGEVNTRVVTPADAAKFPQPRLETNERIEINGFRLQEEQTLNRYGWVDQKAGVVHIPIDRAMQLLAQRGLPTRPQAGSVPPSPVNMAREAAARADQSQTKRSKPRR